MGLFAILTGTLMSICVVKPTTVAVVRSVPDAGVNLLNVVLMLRVFYDY